MDNQISAQPRQLYQVDWSGGETDGEVGQNTVQELLNVELDRPGELRPRAPLATPVAVPGAFREFRMAADPSGDSPGGWTVRLSSSGVAMVDDQGVVASTHAFGAAASDLTEVVIYGDLVIVAAVDADGDPIATYMVAHEASEQRFLGPQDEGGYGSISPGWTPGQWKMRAISRVEPNLQQLSFEDMRQYILGNAIVNDDFEVGNLISQANAAIGSGANDVLLLWALDHENPDGGALTSPTEFEYRVQFRYLDGTTSSLSNPIFVGIPGTVKGGNAVIFTVCATYSLDSSISAINVYRRDYTEGSSLELIMTAHVYGDDIEEATSDAGSSMAWRSRDTSTDSPDSESPYLADSYMEHPEFDSSILNDGTAAMTAYNGSIAAPAASVVTAGWRHYGDIYYYMPHHYTFDGQLKVRIDDETNENYGEWIYTARGIAPAPVSGAPSCRIMGGCMVSLPQLTFAAGSAISPRIIQDFLHQLPYWWIPGLIEVSALDDTSGYNGSSQSITGVGTFTASSAPSSAMPIVLFYDTGQPGQLTYDDVEGVPDEERVEVLARHVAMVGGRLVCLNVDVDDERKPSRLAWSEFGKYGSFSENSYNDRGYEDPGAGVGIAAYGPRVLVLHDTSVYALDVSGGSAMNWRSIGEWKDLGCVGPRGYCTTPFGVVFCDQRKAYLWDGQSMRCITEDANKTVAARYSELVAGGISGVGYLPSRHQVAIFGDGRAMVYDITRGAWHTHVYSELASGVQPIGSFESGGVEFLELHDGADYYTSAIDYDADEIAHQWRIDTGDMAMGAPEFVKKLKRVYVQTSAQAGQGTFEVSVNGDTPTRQQSPGSAITRVSKSARGPEIRIVVDIPEGDAWLGSIKEIGFSYKPKRLK